MSATMLLVTAASNARLAVRRLAPPLLLQTPRAPVRRWHRHQAPLRLHRGVASVSTLHAQQLHASDHRGHWHVDALDAASKSFCAAQRVQWLVHHSSDSRRVLALTADASDHSRLLRHVDEHMAFNELERRGHGVFGMLQWCQQALEETGRDKRVFPRGRMAAFLLHHASDVVLERMQRSMTSPLAARRAVLDLLQHFQLLESEGISPAAYLTNARGSEDPAQIELAHTYERYRQLLETHGVTSWDGIVLDVLEHTSSGEAAADAFLDALLRGFTDVVVDDLQNMTPAMVKLVAHVCAHPHIASSLSFSRVLRTGDTCPRSELLATVLQQGHGIDMACVVLASEATVSDTAAAEIRAHAERILYPYAVEPPPSPPSAAIQCLAFDTVAAEELGVTQLIQERLTADPLERIAVLAPTYADAQRLAAAFASHGIAVQDHAASVASGGHLFDEPGVNAVFSLLVALCYPSDSRHLYNVLRSDHFGLSPQLLARLMEKELRSHVALFDVLDAFVATRGASLGAAAARDPALASELEAATKFVVLIKQLRDECHAKSTQELVQTFLEETGRLESLLDPASAADEQEAVALADFLRELEAAQRVVQSAHVPFVVPYLQQLRESQVRASSAAAARRVTSETAAGDGIAVLPLTARSVESLDAHVLVFASMRDSKFPGRMKRLTTPLPYKLLSAPFPVQTRSEFVAQSERLAFQALTCASRQVILSYAKVAAGPSGGGSGGGAGRTKQETLSRVLMPLWHEPPSPFPTGDCSVSCTIDSRASLVSSGTEPLDAYDPAHLSYSQISEYLRCPQRYFLARVMKLPTEASSAMMFGRALHEAIASFATSVQSAAAAAVSTTSDGGDSAWLGDAYAQAHRVFDAAWESDGKFVSRDQERELRAQGHRSLDAFCAQHAARDIEHVEHAFEVFVPESAVALRGVWDRVDRTARGAVIHEFKSNMGGAARDVGKLARASLQLKLYMFAFERAVGAAPHGAVLEMIGDASSGSSSSSDGFVAYTPEVADEALEALDSVAEGLRAGRFAPRPNYMECAFCPFAASACRAGAHATQA